MSDKRNTNWKILDELLKDIPPMRDEWNQKEIDEKSAELLREALAQRQATDDIEKYLRS